MKKPALAPDIQTLLTELDLYLCHDMDFSPMRYLVYTPEGAEQIYFVFTLRGNRWLVADVDEDVDVADGVYFPFAGPGELLRQLACFNFHPAVQLHRQRNLAALQN